MHLNNRLSRYRLYRKPTLQEAVSIHTLQYIRGVEHWTAGWDRLKRGSNLAYQKTNKKKNTHYTSIHKNEVVFLLRSQKEKSCL